MFDSSSLGAVALRIANSDQVTSKPIDWKEETRLSPSLLNLNIKPVPFQDPKVVILKGATGFLGHALVKPLVENSNIERFYSIEVGTAGSRKSLINFKKAVIY
jgi:hypothetical protein